MKTNKMDFRLQNEILCEAEKVHGFDKIINVIAKVSPFGVMYAVSFVDGYGIPTERLTGWHTNPVRLLDAIKAQGYIKELRKNQ